jgi:hypothetical protein
MRRLDDGVPRTILLLFHILLEGSKQSTFDYLEQTMDKVTPHYKHIMDDLSKQQRPIVHAIALNWDAMSARDIASQTRMESKKVSAQLRELEKQWRVEKVKTSTKNHLYRLSERFFNIWYLMRYGRKQGRQQVKWLTLFFEGWCQGDELIHRVRSLTANLGNGIDSQLAVMSINALINFQKIDTQDKFYLYQQVDDRLKAGEFDELTENPIKEEHPGIGEAIYDKGVAYLTTGKIAEAQKLFFQAAERHIKNADINLALTYMVQNDPAQKSKAINLTEAALANQPEDLARLQASATFVWTDRFEQAKDMFESLLRENSWQQDGQTIAAAGQVMLLFLQKKQTNLVDKWFKAYELKGMYLPLYYALMHLMKDKYPNEHLKMGSELKQTVDEILTQINS